MKYNGIDAGHGGNDSGALGIGNVKECDITLEISKMIDSKLNNQSGIKNHMSRTTNTTMSLNARTTALNKLGLNTLVSVHCNAYNLATSKGFEIFYMSENGKKLAECILEEIKAAKLYTQLREGGIKYKNLHMNRESKATSCLVELGFITNKEDLDLINKNKDKFAECIAKGICKYNKVPYVTTNTSTADKVHNHVNSKKFINGSYAGKTAKVTASSLNVRYDRGTNHKVVGSLEKGAVVKLQYCLNGWISIEGYKGNAGLGYVSTDYLEVL